MADQHKTTAPWLTAKQEKQEPVLLSEGTYYELGGAWFNQKGRNVLRERRSDNELVIVIGGIVFEKRK